MKYDYKKAKMLIEKEKENIKEAVLGMHEDWFWTAETIFENDKYTIDLEEKNLKIAGIDGSSWATPVLEIIYKDETEKIIVCGTGDKTGTMPIGFGGAITDMVNEYRSNLKLEEE